MKLYELYTRKAMFEIVSKLQKERKVTQKQLISILHTTRDRYIKYALKGCPPEQLEVILQVLDIDIFQLLDRVDLRLRELMENKMPPINTTPSALTKTDSIHDTLYQTIREHWLSMNPETVTLLDAWEKETGIYYLYLLIVKQTFITPNDYILINKYHFNIHDYLLFMYYGLKHEEIETMYENQTSDLYMYLIIKQLSQFYRAHKDPKDPSSLPVLLQLAENSLLQQ